MHRIEEEREFSKWPYLLTIISGLVAGSAILASYGVGLFQNDPPVARVISGTYVGVHNDEYNTDHFLGIPYAQSPVGDLRFRVPQSLKTTWTGRKNATEYGYACVGYGEDTAISAEDIVDEDCLTLNIIRPGAQTMASDLPVLVWIHGGGYYGGSSREKRYNLTFLVQESFRMGKPLLAVGINYRLSGWGFLWSQEIVNQGIANLGLRDQRLALSWIQENIGAFGGDPKRVTIWGESAGSGSVSSQLLAFDGRDDGLFHGAIAVSGSPVGFGIMDAKTDSAERAYIQLVEKVGCSSVSDRVQCLRSAPYSTLNDVLNTTFEPTNDRNELTFGPLPDGDIVFRDSISQLQDGSFVRVPLMIGDCSDEGTFFAGVIFGNWGINSDDDIINCLSKYGLSRGAVDELLRLFPQNSSILVPQSIAGNFNTTIGHQWKRLATIVGDLTVIGPRRLTLWTWAQQQSQAPLFNFRFDMVPNGFPDYFGATHAVDIPFTFYNLNGVGFPNISPPFLGPNPFGGKPKSYFDLAELVSRMWISFTNHGSPNFTGQKEPSWLPYTLDSPNQYIFNAESPSHLGVDDLREEAMEYIIQLILSKEASFS